MEDEILHYFNKMSTKYGLPSLDNTGRMYYTRVTLSYIVNLVLNSKYEHANVAKVVKSLVENQKLDMLECPDINDMVFEQENSTEHWSYADKGYIDEWYLKYWKDNLKT